MTRRKYFLDNDLLYKKIKLTRKQKLSRLFSFIVLFFFIGFTYTTIFEKIHGSPKEQYLIEELNNVKYFYTILDKRLDNSNKRLDHLRLVDNVSYRPILNMDTVPVTFLNPGAGGIYNYYNLNSYQNKDFLILYLNRIKSLENKVKFQEESFKNIQDRTVEWIREMEHLPLISPVNVEIKMGDGIKFREKHPILGVPAWHHGQDFSAPYGTEVYATGAGIIRYVGTHKGLGNFVIISHDYGYETIYGHLSKFEVKKGDNVKRGDLIALTGNTGYSTGPHLHYQINLYGKYQNPLHFFDDDLTEEEYIKMINYLNSQFKF